MPLEFDTNGLSDTQLREVRDQLARAARLSMLGEMVATIAHEINQPLAAIAANCDAARRWFDKDPPDLVEIRAALDRVTRDQRRVSEVITRLRSFTRAGDSLFHEVQINGAVLEVLTILSAELRTSEIFWCGRCSPLICRW